MTPEKIRDGDLFPRWAFFRCPIPITRRAECCFPGFEIDEIRRQEGRDLARFDLDFDLPEHFLPESRPHLSDHPVRTWGTYRAGRLVTADNYFELFDGILNPKQIEGLRLLRDGVSATAVQPDQ